MSINELNVQKRKVKNELKNYDNEFEKNFQRQPNKTDKEPLRPLYLYYKNLKK